MKTKILILLLTSYLFLGCNEDDNPFTLPDATQKGANTAGCYIDGDLYVLKNAYTKDAWIGSSKTLDLKYSYDEKNKFWYIYIYIVLENKSNKREHISFKLKSKDNFKTRQIGLVKYIEGEVSNSANLYGRGQTQNNAGQVIISEIDRSDKHILISGTFNFSVKDRNTKKTVKVANGRFDLKKIKN